MAVIKTNFWDFSTKIIDLATAKKKNIKHIRIAINQKYFTAFSANDQKNTFRPFMYFDTTSPEADLYFDNTTWQTEYKNYGGREYKKTSIEEDILDKFRIWNFNFKKAPDFKKNYYEAPPIEVIISNLLQGLDKSYQSDIYYGYIAYSGSLRSSGVYHCELKISIPEENLGKKDYDKIVKQFENAAKDIPNDIIIIEKVQLKTAAPRKNIAMEDKYEQDTLTDGNGIRIQRGDIVLYPTYNGHITYGKVISNTAKCVKVDGCSTLLNSSIVYVVRSGNEEKMQDIPWNKIPCDLLDKSESYYL